MKILFFTDTHIRGTNPVSRQDNFYESILIKIQETLDIATNKKCDLIVFGGDLFHSPLVSLNICDEIMDMIEKTNIPFEAVAGNHDENNADWALSSGSTLAHMFRRSKLIRHLDVIENKEIYLKGISYHFDVEEQLKNNLFINENLDPNKTNILVVHAMVTEKPLPFQVTHIPYKTIKTNYDYIWIGHNHHEMGIRKIGENSKMVAPGALCRLTIAENDFNRIPQIFYLDTVKKEEELIKLKNVKPKNEVFDLAKIEAKKKYEVNLDSFVKSLESAKFQGLNLRGCVENIGNDNHIDKKIIDCVLKRIASFETDET